MRVAFYGGSFNPPHVAHAMVASWVLWSDLAEEVWICPTKDHPFGKELLPFEERLRLCEVMCWDLGNSRIIASDLERSVPQETSYTYRTLCHFRDKYPDCPIRPIMGADILGDTSKWKFWDEIMEEFPPIFVSREGYDVQNTPMFPHVSSTLVRSKCRKGEPIKGLVTRRVGDLITRRGLYAT